MVHQTQTSTASFLFPVTCDSHQGEVPLVAKSSTALNFNKRNKYLSLKIYLRRPFTLSVHVHLSTLSTYLIFLFLLHLFNKKVCCFFL